VGRPVRHHGDSAGGNRQYALLDLRVVGRSSAIGDPTPDS